MSHRDAEEPAWPSGESVGARGLSRRNLLAVSGIAALAMASAGQILAQPAQAAVGYGWPLSPIVYPDPRWGQQFGASRPNGRTHLGADFNVAARYLGAPVLSVADGQVIGGQWVQQPSGSQTYLYGNFLKVRHDDGNVATYAHMQGPPSVGMNSRITRGNPIGRLGSTGTNVAHLHFELLTPAGNVDPVTYISARLGGPVPPPPPPPLPIGKKKMWLFFDIGGNGFLMTDSGVTGVGYDEYNLLWRVINSNQVTSPFNSGGAKPETFTGGEIAIIHAAVKRTLVP